VSIPGLSDQEQAATMTDCMQGSVSSGSVTA